MTLNILETDWQHALQHWKDITAGVEHPHFCRFCEKFLFPGPRDKRCVGCPLSLGHFADQEGDEGDCWNPIHPWYEWQRHPTEQNALAVYKFIQQKHKEWKAQNA
jgi:hypothetical protein